MEKPLTGWKVFAMFAAGFGIIIAVNLTLAFQAVATFPGLETKNSYVASQKFQADRAAQDNLNWTVAARLEAGQLVLTVDDPAGKPVRPATLTGTFGRATHVADDQDLTFQPTQTGYIANVTSAPGNWNLRLAAVAPDGTAFRRRIVLRQRAAE
ncbi:FixH family protein [Actibacterium sp. 188UL27-1]|uniref:FixH family protein n=1 Tax=Actibacterium sp. 188UL27-1 TaxID=2786961 RepID=UPI00195E7E3E|nr:FixH family protein [Actibacterium sp. 188UL27-1]MBM7068777.1 FixH family protein [Actibacterium sp. 188UL27-1]